MTKQDLKAAAVRAVRTFIVAFIAIYPGSAILDNVSGSVAFDPNLARSAAAAGVAAVVSLLWRAFLDPSPVPSLKDADQK